MLKRRSRSKMLNWWVLWRVPVLLLIVMCLWWFIVRPIVSEQGWVEVSADFAVCGQSTGGPVQGCVIDGDTLAIGFREEGRRIRLTGFDAPELDGACPAEVELAQQARSALHQWLAIGSFEWNGADEPPFDRYGRELRAARRTIEGEDTEYLADWMVSQGLAAESGWGIEPKNWCEG